MSRIGKRPIEIPEKTEVSVSEGSVRVKGPLGELGRVLRPEIEVAVLGRIVTLTLKRDTKLAQALWGTYAAHISNMISGVTKGFGKKLLIEGVGYRAEVSGNTLVLAIGFSHQVKLPIPEGLKVTVEKNVISMSGIDKEVVGAFAALVRRMKKPEPYKGKGIRYEDEVVRRKQGKRAAATAS